AVAAGARDRAGTVSGRRTPGQRAAPRPENRDVPARVRCRLCPAPLRPGRPRLPPAPPARDPPARARTAKLLLPATRRDDGRVARAPLDRRRTARDGRRWFGSGGTRRRQ